MECHYEKSRSVRSNPDINRTTYESGKATHLITCLLLNPPRRLRNERTTQGRRRRVSNAFQTCERQENHTCRGANHTKTISSSVRTVHEHQSGTVTAVPLDKVFPPCQNRVNELI
jgi:hypothetical protein